MRKGRDQGWDRGQESEGLDAVLRGMFMASTRVATIKERDGGPLAETRALRRGEWIRQVAPLAKPMGRALTMTNSRGLAWKC